MSGHVFVFYCCESVLYYCCLYCYFTWLLLTLDNSTSRKKLKFATGVNSSEELAATNEFNISTASISDLCDLSVDTTSSAAIYNPLLDNSESEIMFSTTVSTSEREQMYTEMDNLRAERDQLKTENNVLKEALAAGEIGLHSLKNPEKCVMVTELNFPVLEKLLDYLCKGMRTDLKTTRTAMNNQIIITIIRLRHNISFDILSFLCNKTKTTVIRYFWKWIDIMHIKLKFLIRMQDRDHIFQTIPSVFKAKFPRLTSIIDCFEVFVESPTSLMARAQFYSQYKKHCTIKVLISCTPLGAINYI